MSSTPRKRRAPRTPRTPKTPATPRTPATPVRLYGFFNDGIWLCNCEPRLPALHLQVKKSTANKGRWFYTCQNRACGFFLFAEEAETRERDALLRNNSRSEPSFTSRIGPRRSDDNDDNGGGGADRFPPPRPSTPTPGPRQRIFRGEPGAGAGELSDTDEEMAAAQRMATKKAAAPAQEPSTPSRRGSSSRSSGTASSRTLDMYFTPTQQSPGKRKRDAMDVDDGEEDFDDAAFDSDMERQLAQIADDSARKQPLEHKSLLGAGPPRGGEATVVTPTAQRARDAGDGGLPTPVSRNSLLIATEARDRDSGSSSVKKVKFADEPVSMGRGSSTGVLPDFKLETESLANTTPTPARTRDALGTAGASAGDDYDITEEVLGILAGEPVSEPARRAVREALNRHALRARGVARGRDIARAGLETRDSRIAELQARVTALENSRRVDRERLRELSSGLARLSRED
ncbi:hypothetical protein NKR23_g528 [Pleurostoma richardsiae]|uniref:GRF-type domain-containing protein n=1 Tax=Pleurostoma richardsiae TaxID=41990 RepID=A0AA38RTA7_9PEZI|nr:hypothetical protein NKR23_g528 [Pleurostoma richardsiae]